MKRKSILQFVTLAAVLVGAVVMFARQNPNSVEPSPAPAWELPHLDGNVVKSSAYDGKVVVLNFWATWCPPCRMEIPGFVDFQKEHEDEVVIVGVSLDQTGTAGVKEFAEQMKINYPIVMGDAEIVEAYGGIQAIPTTFIIDREGTIRNAHRGYLTKSGLEKAVKPLL